MNAALFAYSRRGCATARRVMAALADWDIQPYTMERFAEDGFAPLGRPAREFYGPIFEAVQAMIFVSSVGLAVREVAPHLKSKATDPAVLVLDELGQYVIPVLSGHIGGANELAKALAASLGAQAVITTATDINGRFSVDAWAVQNGCAIASLPLAKAVSAAVLEGDVPFLSDFPVVTDLPRGLAPGDAGALGACIGVYEKTPFAKTLRLVPRVVRLGIGCRKGTDEETDPRSGERSARRARHRPARGEVRRVHRSQGGGGGASRLLPLGGAERGVLHGGRAARGARRVHPFGICEKHHRRGQRVRESRAPKRRNVIGKKDRPQRRDRGGGGRTLGGALCVSWLLWASAPETMKI